MVVVTWLVGFAVAAVLLPPSFVAAARRLSAVHDGLLIPAEARAGARRDVPRRPLRRPRARRRRGDGRPGVDLAAGVHAVRVSQPGVPQALHRECARRPRARSPLPGRGYVAGDASWLQSAGLSSAYMAVVVLAIYVNNPDLSRLYGHPKRLLLLCPVLLFWATRTWMRAHRRQIHDDPVVAVAGDPMTYLLGAMAGLIVLSSICRAALRLGPRAGRARRRESIGRPLRPDRGQTARARARPRLRRRGAAGAGRFRMVAGTTLADRVLSFDEATQRPHRRGRLLARRALPTSSCRAGSSRRSRPARGSSRSAAWSPATSTARTITSTAPSAATSCR